MSEAKQYAADAVKSLSSRGYPSEQYANLAGDVIDKMKAAVHFQMPHGGRILNDHLRGLEGADVNLPFKNITIAFTIDSTDLLGRAMKHVVSARELSIEEFTDLYVDVDTIGPNDGPHELLSTGSKKFIRVALAQGDPASDMWALMPGHIVIPATKWTDGVIGASGTPLVRSAIAHLDVAYTMINQRALDAINTALRSAIFSVLELCEALACSNVTHIPVSKKKAVQPWLAKYKTPEYEVRELMLKAPLESVAYDGTSTPTGRGVRQHLVCGHIRRFARANPPYQIWVNGYVRGDASLGAIEKSYNITT